MIVLLLLGTAAWLVPSYLSAERYRRRLEAALKWALHRPVTFGDLSFHLLPRPGFSISNAVVGEDPAFGSEPFARVDRIECDLRWRSLWRSRLDFARLRLEHPSLNLVRNERGEWNVENLLVQSGIALPPSDATPGIVTGLGGELDLEAEGARIDFKVGADKKPFAITDLRARLSFDRARRLVRYRLAGNPVRTDLSLPTPGVVELAGEWTPGRDLEGPLRATVRTRGALLYDWVPLITGRNPEIYGVLDAEIRLTGSLRVLNLEGESRLSQLHRWEQLPPSDPMPWTIRFRGQFDRKRGRALMESVEASFANSYLHISGSVDRIPRSPELDLVVALEHSRLEDLFALSRRLWASTTTISVQGRVDGMLAIQGPWARRRYGGFLGAREVLLNTASGTFPVSELAVRIDSRGARLAPLRVTLAPRVELVAEGAVSRADKPPRYELHLSAKAVPLRDVLGFGRALGLRSLQGLDATGVGTATFRLAGSAWPLAPPTLTGHAELQAARLLIPGLTEPLNLPRASIQVSGDQITADPVRAVLGTSVFSGRLRHQGERKQPWEFDIRADNLSLEQGALWFDVLGRRRPLPLLERLPGLSSFAARRAVASTLFAALNARGYFATPTVTYRALTLRDFRGTCEISGRVIRVVRASFRAGGGRSHGSAKVDLTKTPAPIVADISVEGVSVQALVSQLPAALRGASGAISANGHLETQGLSREEMSTNLTGEATVSLKNLSFGDFDPLGALLRDAGWGTLEPAHGQAALDSTIVTLEVRDRRVMFRKASLDLTGARLGLTGTYGFDGVVDVDVHADLRHLRRRWLSSSGDVKPDGGLGRLHLVGPLDRLVVTPEIEVSRANP